MYDDTLKIFAGIDTDGVKSGMKDVKSLVDKGMNAVKSVTSAGASAISGVTKAVTTSIATAGSGVLAFGGYAVNAGKNFEKSMSNVMATMGITKDTIQDGQNSYELLAETAKKMGETTKFSASESADALNFLALAGYDAQKSCEALPAVLNLAQAGNMDLARTSDLVTDAMSALGIEATNENLTHFGDVLAKTSSRSNTSVAQLGEAMLVCGGQSRLAGLELEETSTMLGILADNGIKGAEGGTALRNLLKNIYTPTSQASKAMQALGIQTSDAGGNLRNVQDILLDTMSALENLSGADKMTAMGDIFDVRTIAAASATLNNCSERYNELYGEIMDCNGAMEQMAETQNDNLEGDIYSLKSAFEAVGVAVEEKLNKSLRNAVQLGTSYLRQLNDSFKKNGFDGLANSLGDELGDAVTKISARIPDFINIGSSIVKSFMKGISDNSAVLAKSASEIVSSLANGVLDLFPMFITVGGQLVSDFADGISEKIPVLTEKAVNIIEWLYNGLIENLPKIIDTALELTQKFGDKLSENSDKIISAGVEIISILADGIKKGIPKVLKTAKKVIKDFADALGEEFKIIKPFTDVIQALTDNFETVAGVIGTAVTAVMGFKSAVAISRVVKTATTAVSGFISCFSVAPILLVIAGVGALGYALSEFFKQVQSDDFSKKLAETDEYSKKLDENRDKLNKLGDSAKDTADKEQIHLDKVENLWKELDKLADSSGRVKKSDQDRAEYILGELNQALGTEYSMVDGQIQKYTELEKSIDSVIEKKRAESMLNAYSGQYEEALNQQSETVQTERDAYIKRQVLQSAMDEMRKKLEIYSEDLEKHGSSVDKILSGSYKGSDNAHTSAIKNILEKINDVQTDYGTYSVFDATQLKADYVNASNAYNVARSDLENINSIISNYEQAEVEAIAGNYDKVAEYLNYRKTGETDWADLAKQTEDEVTGEIQKNLAERQTAYDLANKDYINSSNSASKEILDNAKKDLQDYLIEVEKMGFSDFLNENQKKALEQIHREQSLGDSFERKVNSAWDVKVYSGQADEQIHNAKKDERIRKALKNRIPAMEELLAQNEKDFETIKEQYKNGVDGVTDETVARVQEKVNSSKQSLWDAYNKANDYGLSGLTDGMTQHESEIQTAVTLVSEQLGTSVDKTEKYLREHGSTMSGFLIDGISLGLEITEPLRNRVNDSVNAVLGLFNKDFRISSPSKLMRDEIGKWILPGIAVGVDDTVNETANNMNSSINSLISQVDSPEISPLKVNSPEITEPNVPELPPINIESPKINIPEQSAIELNSPEFDEPDVPDFSPLQVKSPEIIVSDSEPVELISPEVIESEIPQLSPMNIDSPEINIPEQPEIKLNSPEITEPDIPDIPEKGMFTQQIELLREFLPENNIPQIADERITEEIQAQLDEISVNLNADSFISKFQNVLANIGVNAVPQYSTVYNQIQTAPQNHESNKLEIPQNTGQNPPEISIFIGDEEIKNFVVSTLNEANAVSGGASF